jgi:hypothetical protein
VTTGKDSGLVVLMGCFFRPRGGKPVMTSRVGEIYAEAPDGTRIRRNGTNVSKRRKEQLWDIIMFIQLLDPPDDL